MEHTKSHAQDARGASVSNIGPIAAKDRIESLDVLRGLALFMILAANMSGSNSPIYYLEETGQHWGTGRVDHIVETIIAMFIQTESVGLFSFLFGLGFAMQLIRARSQDFSFILLYVRRLVGLIVIGLIHAYLIWMGDILILYGLLGFLLLLFRNLKPNVVLVIAIFLYLIPPMRWELSLRGLLLRPICCGRVPCCSNLLQSIVCTLIFYRYGLGLYGKVGPASGFALTLAVFAAQVYLSVLWSRWFQYGPLEWLWRSLTYGRPQAMRI